MSPMWIRQRIRVSQYGHHYENYIVSRRLETHGVKIPLWVRSLDECKFFAWKREVLPWRGDPAYFGPRCFCGIYVAFAQSMRALDRCRYH